MGYKCTLAFFFIIIGLGDAMAADSFSSARMAPPRSMLLYLWFFFGWVRPFCVWT